jgi:hypothetical protein
VAREAAASATETPASAAMLGPPVVWIHSERPADDLVPAGVLGGQTMTASEGAAFHDAAGPATVGGPVAARHGAA